MGMSAEENFQPPKGYVSIGASDNPLSSLFTITFSQLFLDRFTVGKKS